MPASGSRSHGGLHRTEAALFVGGVLAFAFLMLVFASGLSPTVYLPLVAGWVIAGLTFVWWFDRHLARESARPRDGKISRLATRRRRR